MQMRHLVASGLVVLFGSVLLRAGADTIVKNHDGTCQVSVPSDWSATPNLGIATSADKQASVAVSSPKMIDSFAQLKQTAQMVFKGAKVTKDAPTEFAMEGVRAEDGKAYTYKAVTAGKGFCIAQVTLKGDTPTDQARSIVGTVKGAQ